MSERAAEKTGLSHNRNFVLLFLGRMVSRVGDSLYSLGITWFILDLTGAGTTMSLYLAVGMVTYLLMGPLAGVLVDRWDRVRIIYGTDLLRGLLISLAGILYFLGIEAELLLVVLFSITVLTNMCSALFNPAATALTPRIVSMEMLTRANSLQSMVDSGASITGLVLGGIIYTLVGIQGIFIINAISFLLSGLSEMFIRIPKDKKQQKQNTTNGKAGLFEFWAEFREGYAFILSQRWLILITLFSFMINLFSSPLMSIYIPYIVNQIMQIQPIYLSYIQAALGAGVLLGSLAMSTQTPQERIARGLRLSYTILLIPLAAMAICLFLYGNGMIQLMYALNVFIGASFVLGFMTAHVNIPINVAIQRKVPNAILGRVDAAFSTLLMTGVPIGMIAGGILTDRLPMTWMLTGTTAALVTVGLGMWLIGDRLDF